MRYYLIKYKEKPIGDSGESTKSDYNLADACNACGTGAKLNGPLKVSGILDTRKEIFQTLAGDFIISGGLYEKIRELYRDFELLNVVDTKSTPLSHYHLTSNFLLPRFNETSTGFEIDGQCPKCRRNGYFNSAVIGDLERNIPTTIKPLNLVYKKIDFENLKNPKISCTWESKGLSNKTTHGNHVTRYARPWIMISEQLKDIFDAENTNTINYEQIRVE
jgi:hypothetical protein